MNSHPDQRCPWDPLVNMRAVYYQVGNVTTVDRRPRVVCTEVYNLIQSIKLYQVSRFYLIRPTVD